MKNQYVIAAVLALAICAVSFMGCVFAWVELPFVDANFSVHVRSFGVKLQVGEASKDRWFKFSSDFGFYRIASHDSYYPGEPEFPRPYRPYMESDWSFCGAQFFADLSPGQRGGRGITLFLPIPVLIVIYIGIAMLLKRFWRYTLRKRGRCEKCAHTLTSEQAKCPECGTHRHVVVKAN